MDAIDGDIVIKVDDASVTYRVYSDKRPTMRGQFARAKAREFTAVEAVKGFTATIHSGEVVGIIGSNGSGKTTLLQAIAGLQPIESGAIYVRGEPTLLGVGAVLNNRLSGARNVLLGSMALGMTRAEAESRFADIVRFAGVGAAIDRPLRTYSSGMKSRLHFAIATSVDPDILLIDEVLAVGDRAFKRKSEKRIKEIEANAKVVVVVSHNLGEVRNLCSRVIWLNDGVLTMDGEPDEVIGAYEESGADED
jgi:teichoic acid transport system ATP-binding protein